MGWYESIAENYIECEYDSIGLIDYIVREDDDFTSDSDDSYFHPYEVGNINIMVNKDGEWYIRRTEIYDFMKYDDNKEIDNQIRPLRTCIPKCLIFDGNSWGKPRMAKDEEYGWEPKLHLNDVDKKYIVPANQDPVYKKIKTLYDSNH